MIININPSFPPTTPTIYPAPCPMPPSLSPPLPHLHLTHAEFIEKWCSNWD